MSSAPDYLTDNIGPAPSILGLNMPPLHGHFSVGVPRALLTPSASSSVHHYLDKDQGCWREEVLRGVKGHVPGSSKVLRVYPVL